MAVTGTQLYNKKHVTINPISDGEVIVSTALGSRSTVHKDLAMLYDQINKLSGDQETVNNITVDVKYAKSKSKEKADILNYDEGRWQEDFSIPNITFPYTWKRTIFGYKKTNYTFYEICAVDVAERTQTIYVAKSTGAAPTIEYKKNGDGSEDLTCFDTTLPEGGWTEAPQSITPATPYVFISTRKMKEGKWQRFTEPAQYGRWAFDSMLELRYQVTQGNIPEIDATEENPGDEWKTESPTEFTGSLWMITATSVNGVYNKDDVGVIWKGPNLLGIVK